jgi:hypothetical protein
MHVVLVMRDGLVVTGTPRRAQIARILAVSRDRDTKENPPRSGTSLADAATMRLSYCSNIVAILTLGLAPLALLHCSSNHLGTPPGADLFGADASAEGGGDDTGDTQEECATPCGVDLVSGCHQESTCSASTVCHYTCPNEVDVTCTGYDNIEPYPDALCEDAGIDAGSDGCRNYLASCKSR